MLSRANLGRQAVRLARQQQRRGFASPASASFNYQTGEAQGIKFASRDIPGAVGTLAIVAQAGTRFQSLPGLTEALEKFAFKGTERRSSLRIQRESELLGAELQAWHTRENLCIGAKFLRDDLPYFVELLAEVAGMTKYQAHVFNEQVVPTMTFEQKKLLASTTAMAINSVHGIAFHRGLGTSLHPTSSVPLTKYVDVDTISDFAASAYAKPSFAVVGNGVEHSELNKWINEFFTDVPSSPLVSLTTEKSKYHGGEERIAHASGNTMIIAFPGSSSATGSSYKPEVAVLAALLGGETSIKWNTGFSLLSKAAENLPGVSISTKSLIYSDAGLLTITLTGGAGAIRDAAGSVASTLKTVADGSLSKEDFQKAKALAKFKELEFGQNTQAGMELTGSGLVANSKPYQIDDVANAVDGVTEDKVKQVAKEALENKASVSAVGDLYVLPWAEEIGLKV